MVCVWQRVFALRAGFSLLCHTRMPASFMCATSTSPPTHPPIRPTHQHHSRRRRRRRRRRPGGVCGVQFSAHCAVVWGSVFVYMCVCTVHVCVRVRARNSTLALSPSVLSPAVANPSAAAAAAAGVLSTPTAAAEQLHQYTSNNGRRDVSRTHTHAYTHVI